MTSNSGPFPFEYPSAADFRHGPAGYQSYESFRPWLRDECDYRCVYCLMRERWSPTLQHQIDHLVAQILKPESKVSYENLAYACPTCNATKSHKLLDSPRTQLIAEHVIVYEDGRIEGKTREARRIIRILGLDSPDFVEFRLLMIGIIRLSLQKEGGRSASVYRQLMSYPDDLPDLARLKPPTNIRPDGIEQSAFARRQRGELPDVY